MHAWKLGAQYAAWHRLCACRRCSQEIRRIWVGYWTQCDPTLGQRIAMKLRQEGSL